MNERGMSKSSFVGILVIIVVIVAAGYMFLSGGGETTQLEVSNLVFCERQPQGFQNYKEQPNATYSKEEFEDIWLYAEVDNLAKKDLAGKEVRIWLVVDLVVKQNGSVVKNPMESGNPIKFEKEVIEKGLYIQRSLNVEDLSPGTYTLVMDIEDQYSGTSDNVTGEFTLT